VHGPLVRIEGHHGCHTSKPNGRRVSLAATAATGKDLIAVLRDAVPLLMDVL